MSNALPLRSTLAVLAALAAVLLGAPAAQAQLSPLEPQTLAPESPYKAPPGFNLTPAKAVGIVDRLPSIRRLKRDHPTMEANVDIPLYRGDARRYSVHYVEHGESIADVHI